MAFNPVNCLLCDTYNLQYLLENDTNEDIIHIIQ